MRRLVAPMCLLVALRAGSVDTYLPGVSSVGEHGSPGREVLVFGTEQYPASICTQRHGQCLPTHRGVESVKGLSALRWIE
jgi:hypothetical protein